MLPTTANEKENLEAHVDLCALRYAGLDERLTSVEAKLDLITSKIEQFKTDLLWILIKAGVSIFVSIAGLGYAGIKMLGH